MTKRTSVLLAVFGICLLLPAGTRWFFPPSLQTGDEIAAFQSLATAPLRELPSGESADLTVILPDDALWRRVRKEWGDPGYIVAAVSENRRKMYCFDRLGLKVRAANDHGEIGLEPATNALYGFSTECLSTGLVFRARPGATIRIRVTRDNREEVPPGELTVRGYWSSEIKDRLAGLQLERDYARYMNALAIAGAILIAAATRRLVADGNEVGFLLERF